MVLGEVMGDKILYVEIIDRTPPLMAVMDGFLDLLFGRSLVARHLLALVFIFFQAAYFAILLINNKAYNESTYVPALIFGLLSFVSFDMMAMSQELIASTLILLSLNNLFKEIEFRIDRDSIVLNLGVFIGLASLFIFSYSIFLLGAVLILIVFARTTLRKVLLIFFGYALVHGILFTIYYCYGQTGDLWRHFYLANFSRPAIVFMSWGSLFALGILPIAYLVFSFFMLTREARFTKYQSQLSQVMFLWLLVAIVQIIFTAERTPHSFFTCIPSLAYYFSHYLLLIRRRWIAESMLWILLIGLLSINYLSVRNSLTSVDFKRFFPQPSSQAEKIKDKKVMVLGNDLPLYQQNSLGGSFLDWDLSKKYVEQPEYYENIIRINKSFQKNPPDVIVDTQNLMGPILEKIPSLKNEYRKEGELYWRQPVTSN